MNWTPKKIRALRKKHSLTQTAFSELLGVSQNYIHLLEKGVKSPSKILMLLLGYVERRLNEKKKGGEKGDG